MDYTNDSGYDSSFVTPNRPIGWSNAPKAGPTYSSSLNKYNQFPFCDGNGSPSTASETTNDSDSDEDVFTDKPHASIAPTKKKKDVHPRMKRARSATVPQRTILSRPTLPASFYSEGSLRTTKAGSGVLARRLKNHGLRTPDRFIPLRDSMTPCSDMYRVTKSVKKLSWAEKLRRDKTASPDAFVFRRRLVSPMAVSLRLHARSDTGAIRSSGMSLLCHTCVASCPNILLVSTTIVPLPLSSSTNVPPQRQVRQRVRIYHYHDDREEQEEAAQHSVEDHTSNLHQVSYGSAWTVGGVAPVAPSALSGTAVNNGRGHLVHAGTNARMFRTNYSTAKLKVAEELDKHRDRLATALEFDQSARTLDFNVNAKSITRQQQPRKSTLKPRKTFWDGVQWKNDGPLPSKSIGRSLSCPRG